MTAEPTPASVLNFWFEPEAKARWFKSDPAFDTKIKERFGDLIDSAIRGTYDDWRKTGDGALALCLVLDQFPRNVWRGTARAFAGDGRAREVARDAIERRLDRDVAPERRLFFYLPFEHSENLADQDRAVALIEALGDEEQADYARRHRDIIARFGRFPHRNAMLSRTSTAEELAFLKEPGSSF